MKQSIFMNLLYVPGNHFKAGTDAPQALPDIWQGIINGHENDKNNTAKTTVWFVANL